MGGVYFNLNKSGYNKSMRVCVAGGSGFIGSHLAKRLKRDGHYVVVADIKENEYFKQEEFCDEFHLVDLRSLENCLKVTRDCDWVFNLACLMGGMGTVSFNHGTILYINIMISFNMLEASRINKVERFFYSSSACIYPEYRQGEEENEGLKEEDAWPADPQDAYGLEKLCTEELCMHYDKEFGIKVRIARFHNIYGPYGTWKGGKEKAPAAFARKAIVASDYVEVWGDGEQTRSFCYIDDCIEGVLLLMKSEYNEPLNIGSDFLISINDLALLSLKLAGKENVELRHIPGPIGVRGRNSDNSLIQRILHWTPSTTLQEGLLITINWVKEEIDKCPDSHLDLSVSKTVPLCNPTNAYDLL